MGDQSIALKKHLLELLKPRTTLENALQSLSSPCLKPETYAEGDNEPLLIFLGYMKFIMSRQPEGRLDGIWEEILSKTIRHSRYFTGPLMVKILVLTRTYPIKIFTWIDPEMINQIKNWLHESLSSCNKCQNPYIQLELFRLLIIFAMKDREMNWECLTETFMHAMCEANPHRFYPSDDEDDLLFGIVNLNYVIEKLYCKLMEIFDSNDVSNLNGDRFISHIVQIMVIFTSMADSNPINGNDRDPLSYCCNVIHNFLYNFQHIVSRPSIRPYVIEAIRDLTATIINSKEKDNDINLRRINYRADILLELNVHSKSCDLPKLLLLRQVQDPWRVSRHALLLRGLKPIYKNDEHTLIRQLFGSDIVDDMQRDIDCNL